jgi:hypothetical protein
MNYPAASSGVSPHKAQVDSIIFIAASGGVLDPLLRNKSDHRLRCPLAIIENRDVTRCDLWRPDPVLF